MLSEWALGQACGFTQLGVQDLPHNPCRSCVKFQFFASLCKILCVARKSFHAGELLSVALLSAFDAHFCPKNLTPKEGVRLTLRYEFHLGTRKKGASQFACN